MKIFGKGSRSAAAILAASIFMCACVSACSGDTNGRQETESSGIGIDSQTEGTFGEPEETSDIAATSEDDVPETYETTVPHTPENYEYALVWEDDFDGDELNTDDWNYEIHSPGWVNNELQFYGEYEECVFVEDGDLVIQPVMVENEDGTVIYRSARVNTMRNHEFTYGRIEARIKTPLGRGYLPAFWMMPAREMTYGSWPRGGEIDIMEVVGGYEDTTYGTIHYGVPHRETQSSYTLPDGERFCDDYHVFAVEWEPGSIRWYVDDVEIGSANDWFSAASEGAQERDYPAPFDQQFYIIFNIAIGGNWPGSPDETTPFDESAQMRVDYVRVYQRGWYEEDVTRPERTYEFREADSEGNFVIDDAWDFMTHEGGSGEMNIENSVITVSTSDCGTVDYSIQLVQTGLPVEADQVYTVTFEARADETRNMNVCVTGPDCGYVRYMEDTTVELTDEWTTYSFTFSTSDTDDNARLEFNMGYTDNSSDVYLRAVSVSEAA